MACCVIGGFITKKMKGIEIPMDLEGGREILVCFPELDLNRKKREKVDPVGDVTLAFLDAAKSDQRFFQKGGVVGKDRGAGVKHGTAQIAGVIVACHGVDGGELTGKGAVRTGVAEDIVNGERGVKICLVGSVVFVHPFHNASSAMDAVGLIEQLEYEGFSYDQAVYGVDQVY